MAAKRFRTFNLDFMNMCSLRLALFHVTMETTATVRSEFNMAMSDVDVSSSLDHDEEPLAELTDEELYNLVQETLWV